MDIRYNNILVSEQFLTPQETINKPLISLSGLDTNAFLLIFSSLSRCLK